MSYRKINIISIIILLFICVGCFLYEPIKSHLVTSYKPNYSSRANNLKTQPLYKPVSYNLNKAKPVTLKQVINARLHTKQMHIVGQLVEPSCHLHLPIGLGVNNNTLMLAAGTMRSNDKMGQGNFALAGHHMLNKNALFTPLYLHAKPGQMIYMTDLHHIYSYKLYLRKTVNEHDVNIINNINRGHPIITLITCNSGHLTNKRLELRGKLVHIYPLNKASQQVKSLLAGKTNNYKVLRGY